jgi:hypothetical protein
MNAVVWDHGTWGPVQALVEGQEVLNPAMAGGRTAWLTYSDPDGGLHAFEWSDKGFVDHGVIIESCPVGAIAEDRKGRVVVACHDPNEGMVLWQRGADGTWQGVNCAATKGRVLGIAVSAREDVVEIAWKETGDTTVVHYLRVDYTGTPIGEPTILTKSRTGDFYGLNFADFDGNSRIITHYRDYGSDESRIVPVFPPYENL